MHDATVLIRRHAHLVAMVLCCTVFPAFAEDEESGIPPLRDLPPLEGDIPQPEATIPEEPTAPVQNAETIAVIRKGIVQQKSLLDVLRSITDRTTADAAAKQILRIASDLRVWGAELDSRAPEDEVVMGEYEREYLPIIEQLNREIRKESERILTYRFFGSARLYEALIELVRQAQ